MSFEFDTLPLADDVRLRCEDCDRVDVAHVLVKTGEEIHGPPGRDDLPPWTSTPSGWRCPECERDRDDVPRWDLGEPVTVPEPPSEWRFCQACGDRIASTRLDGRLCADCADDTEGSR